MSVEIDRVRQYIGRYDTPDSREPHHRLFAEWESTGAQPAVHHSEITGSELVGRFWLHIEQHSHKPDGLRTSELNNFRYAMRPIGRLYGSEPAHSIGGCPAYS